MKLTMEIQGHNSGVSPHTKKPDEMVTYATVWGTDTNGRYARARLYGTVAIALNNKLAGMLEKDEVISAKRIAVTFNGEWQSRTVVKDGKEDHQRTFFPKEADKTPAFFFLDGPALESARLRNDATQSLRKAEKLRSAGQLALAYEAVAQFVANYAGVPLDLEKFLADSAADDAEFGATAGVETDPEAAAAAHYAREDRVRDIPDEAKQEVNPPEASEEAPVQPALQEAAPMDFGADDEVLGPDISASSDNVPEEDAIVLDTAPADEVDVLDDTPAKQTASLEATVPPAANPSPFGARSTFQPQQASKPFSRPEPVREAPQPVARPVPTSTERPAMMPFRNAGPKF
jgi:hypothetical protein